MDAGADDVQAGRESLLEATWDGCYILIHPLPWRVWHLRGEPVLAPINILSQAAIVGTNGNESHLVRI